jgi:hypothetical protein
LEKVLLNYLNRGVVDHQYKSQAGLEEIHLVQIIHVQVLSGEVEITLGVTVLPVETGGLKGGS